jgi:glycine reductase
LDLQQVLRSLTMNQPDLNGKKVAVFGERDDVAGTAVRNCIAAAGGEIVYETTSCFV